MAELKDKLSKYGLVRTCKLVHPDVVMVVITTGFSDKMTKTMEVMDLITKAYPEHKTLETCVMEQDLCIVVLKTKTP